jgi:hypothetical protein
MPAPALYQDADKVFGPNREAWRIADKDILTFCVRQPHLEELAFALADHGHTHVGHVARLSLFTVVDLAGGDRALAEELQHRLHHAGLGLGLELRGWAAPAGDEVDAMME